MRLMSPAFGEIAVCAGAFAALNTARTKGHNVLAACKGNLLPPTTADYRVCPPALPLLLETGALDALLAVVEAGLLAAIVPEVPAEVAVFVA